MLTNEELAAIPFFSSLPDAALTDLGQGAADIHLSTGEYAVHEGEEPALFMVLSGAFDVIKLIDGIRAQDRRAGDRQNLR